MDQIRIDKLKVFAHHGVYETENEEGQDFYVSIVVDLDTSVAGKHDDLSQSVDYGELSIFINNYMKTNTFKLIEAVAENLAHEILLRHPLIQKIKVQISKPHAPIPLPFSDVSVTVERGYHEAYIAFGSNMGEKEEYIQKALEALENESDIFVTRTSSLIETKPYGGVEQDDFLNGVVKVKTLLSPYELLSVCNRIEADAGREREIHWGPRTLDLDILFYDKLILEDEYLTIPHIDIKNRDFVLKPMVEIAPGLVHPVYQKTMKDLLDQLEK